jgi:hypothetical protein
LSARTGHVWRFFRAGGLDQVRLDTRDDLQHLAELDLKYWVALSCPVKGLEFDGRTLELIDTDHDGRIRAPEIIAAVSLVATCLKEPGEIAKRPAALPLAAISESSELGRAALAAARRLLLALGRPDGASVGIDDVTAMTDLLRRHGTPGDGVVPPEAADDADSRRIIEEIMATMGPEAAGGARGVDAAKCEAFFKALAEFSEWWRECEAAEGSAIMPLGASTPEAFAACEAVRTKVEDYFVRCRLAAFDARTGEALDRLGVGGAPLAEHELSAGDDGIAALPLARPGPRRPLPLGPELNPAWADRLARFRAAVLLPLLGTDAAELTEETWGEVKARLAAHAGWRRSVRGAAVEKLGILRVRELLAGHARAAVEGMVRRDAALSAETAGLLQLERLIRYHRALHPLLLNFVNFAHFYDPATPTVFDAGRLFLDQRTCHLCLRVDNPAGHATFAGMSRMFLAYCDCSRPGGGKMTIVAAFTQGEAEGLTVGRNGIFFDRQGRDWDATIVKVIENPISIREAFWMPYRRLSRFISDQIEKFGASKDKAAHDAATAGVSGAVQSPEAGKPARKEPFDIAKFAGIFAAIGLAVGAIGGAMAAMLAAFFKLEWWQMPLAMGGILLVVSGPAMLIAWVKLRQRTLGPLLEGNGWAINGRVKINIPLGNSLTDLRHVPLKARLGLKDPFADKTARRRRFCAAVVLLLAAAAALYYWRAEVAAALDRAINGPLPASRGNPAGAPSPAPEAPKAP